MLNEIGESEFSSQQECSEGELTGSRRCSRTRLRGTESNVFDKCDFAFFLFLDRKTQPGRVQRDMEQV